MASLRLRGVLIAAAVATAVVASPAAATAAVPVTNATPVTIGDGYHATVTVDPAGTGHIAYLGNEPGENTLHYCRLPRGASSCAVQTTLPTSGSTSLEHPFVVVSGETIQVVSYRYGFSSGPFSQDIVYTSTDGGANFGSGVSVGVNPFYLGVLGPGNAVSTVTQAETGGMNFQRLPLDGSSAGAQRANLSPDHPYEGSVGVLPDGTIVATMSDASDNALWRHWGGGGDPNDAAQWTPPQPVGVVRAPHMAFGPSGVFLIGGINGVLNSRKWNGNGFDSPVAVPGDAGEVPQSFATQDPSGRIHALLPQITAQCCKLLYATSDNGVDWAARAFQLGTDLPAQTQVSAAPDHVGLAVWEIATGTGRKVQALPIGPSAAYPELGRSAAASVISAPVLLKRPGASTFAPITGTQIIPVGSIVDARRGRVRITIVLPNGTLQAADFYQGIFQLSQAKTGLATMTLVLGKTKACGRAAGATAVAAKSKKVIRHLWGEGAGRFRTKGRFAAATIRGTTWNTIDRCDGTLIKVTKGSVTVRDFHKRRNVVVKAGHSYLAKA
ncbi:MAG: hypothetical protein ACJ76Z_12390 [Thermoleophilaceae bacterium]